MSDTTLPPSVESAIDEAEDRLPDDRVAFARFREAANDAERTERDMEWMRAAGATRAAIRNVASVAMEAAVAALIPIGDDVGAALARSMEADYSEGMDAEAIEHCNAQITRWVEATEQYRAARVKVSHEG